MTEFRRYSMAMASPEPDWAGLPKHVLDLVCDKLYLLSDYVRFSRVCLSWHSVGIHNQRRQQHKTWNTNPPMLMIPTDDSSKIHRSLYSITDRKIQSFQLPIPYHMRCSGSSYGWLVFFDDTVSPILYNPFLNNNNTILLPSLNTTQFGDYTIQKVVMSANPALEENYVVAALYGQHRLAFMKPGKKSWTYVSGYICLYQDVIFYKGRLLAVDQRREIISVADFNNHKETIIAPGTVGSPIHSYLVESSGGELLMVEKIYGTDDDHQYHEVVERFDVYKLVLDDRTGMVVNRTAIKRLQADESLFLGDSHSMCILARGLIKENSIYYTDDYFGYERDFDDSGIFSLEDGTIQPHYVPNPAHIRLPCPIWLVPTLQEIQIMRRRE